MPVPQSSQLPLKIIASTRDSLKQTVSDLSPEEWLKRPSENTNHIAWIVGHMAFCRSRVLHFMGDRVDAAGAGDFRARQKAHGGFRVPVAGVAAQHLERGRPCNGRGA